MNEEQLRRIDKLLSESDLLDDNGSVEFRDNGLRILFGAISDWYNRSITLDYEGDMKPAEMWCLLYELGAWCSTPRDQRSRLSDVLRQYTGLPAPKIYIRTHIT